MSESWPACSIMARIIQLSRPAIPSPVLLVLITGQVRRGFPIQPMHGMCNRRAVLFTYKTKLTRIMYGRLGEETKACPLMGISFVRSKARPRHLYFGDYGSKKRSEKNGVKNRDSRLFFLISFIVFGKTGGCPYFLIVPVVC